MVHHVFIIPNKNINVNILNLELLINIGGICNNDATNSKYIIGLRNLIVVMML